MLVESMEREHRRELIGSAMVCSVIANVNRDRKKRRKPFAPEDFLPPDPDRKPIDDDQSPEQILQMFQMLLGQQQKQLPAPTE